VFRPGAGRSGDGGATEEGRGHLSDDQKKNLSPNRLLCNQRAQCREKLCFADGLLQDGRDPHQWQLKHSGAGDHDNGDALIMQPSDQVAGQFAPSETEVDEGYARNALGEQALGLGRSRGWSGHVHWHPVLKIYMIPFLTSRTSTWRLLPPRSAGGINLRHTTIRRWSDHSGIATCCNRIARDSSPSTSVILLESDHHS
jgi:hypothetical protein